MIKKIQQQKRIQETEKNRFKESREIKRDLEKIKVTKKIKRMQKIVIKKDFTIYYKCTQRQSKQEKRYKNENLKIHERSKDTFKIVVNKNDPKNLKVMK